MFRKIYMTLKLSFNKGSQLNSVYTKPNYFQVKDYWGETTLKVYNGVAITLNCKWHQSFTKKILRLGNQSGVDKIRQQIVIQCLYKDIMIPQIFSEVHNVF